MANTVLHNERQATLYKFHKVSYDVPFNQRALFSTIWLGLSLKAHLHPRLIAVVCFCFESLYCPNA